MANVSLHNLINSVTLAHTDLGEITFIYLPILSIRQLQLDKIKYEPSKEQWNNLKDGMDFHKKSSKAFTTPLAFTLIYRN